MSDLQRMTNDRPTERSVRRQYVLKVIKMMHIIGQLSKRFCFKFTDSFSATAAKEITAVQICKTSLIHMGIGYGLCDILQLNATKHAE